MLNFEDNIFVVNIKKETADYYVGRNSGLGNPYPVHNKEFDKETSMYLYEKHLRLIIEERNENNKGFLLIKKIINDIEKGKKIKIGCFCDILSVINYRASKLHPIGCKP